MVAVFPMLVLFNPITPSSRVKSHIISEEQYFSNGVDKLGQLYCPVCKEFGGLFLGFYWIQCKHCMNLFIGEKDIGVMS